MQKNKIYVTLAFLGVIFGGLCYKSSHLNASSTIKEESTDTSKKETETMTTELKIEDTHIGSGDEAIAGKRVSVHYEGRLTDGTVFDSSFKRGEPIAFKLGAGQVIAGWDKGIAGLKVGGKRTLTIPSEMGYGERGAGASIPPNATLVFDVELVAVH